ncbi:rod shape-determining protein [Kribbella sp. NPDC049227]|uniref:rod shape-determining protein n=1 Tax=Kribbella sp. NPDC049227 TaxID=3364113 RepID=UPI003723082E
MTRQAGSAVTPASPTSFPRTVARRRRGPWSASQRLSGVAIDLGSVRTRAWMPDHGLIIDAPTIISAGAGGGSRPVHRGVVVDKAGTARVLERLLGRRAGLGQYSMVVLTTPVLCPGQHESVTRVALEVLDPRVVLTIDGVKAAALGAGADFARPLLVLDIGAGLTEVGLLVDGAVTQAHRLNVGTSNLGATTTVAELVQSIVAVVTDLLHLDCGGLVVDALDRGPLLTGGGALRPEITYRLAKQLQAPVSPAPAPHTAAVRGAGLAMVAAHRHPSMLSEQPH